MRQLIEELFQMPVRLEKQVRGDSVVYCTVLQSTVLYSIVLYWIMLYCIILHCTHTVIILYYIYTGLCSVAHCNVVFYAAMYCILLRCITLSDML